MAQMGEVAPRTPPPTPTAYMFTIPAGQSLSQAVSMAPGGNLARIYMPAGWDGDLLTFQLSRDGTTFYDMFREDNTEIAFNITPGTVVTAPEPWLIMANNWIKLRSGSRDNPRKQTEDRVFCFTVG